MTKSEAKEEKGSAAYLSRNSTNVLHNLVRTSVPSMLIYKHG